MQPYQPPPGQQPSQYQNGSPQSLIVSAYQRYRAHAERGEINDYLRSGSAQAAVANIARSSEAQQYQQQGPPQQQGGYQAGGGAPQPGRAYVPPQGVNTDGYPQPRLTQMPQANAMPGWDNTKWKDPNHQTPKYASGGCCRTSRRAPRTWRWRCSGFKRPTRARARSPGDVSIPGVGSVDILQSAGAGGKAWQWGGGNSGRSSTRARRATTSRPRRAAAWIR